MDGRKRFWRAFFLGNLFLWLGSIGYMIIEDYPPLDALYMAVITISTVGFGEIHPLSEAGRTFTIFFILSGVGCLAYAVTSVTEFMLERASDPHLWKKPMEKKIKKLKGHTIICGSGRVGSVAANQLKKAGSPFVVIESDDDHIDILKELNYLHLEGDATRESILLKAGIKKASALLAMLDTDPENLFTVLTARELNPTLHIIARCEHFSAEKRVLRAGADSIISPYVSAGKKVAKRILSHPGADDESDSMDETVPPRWLGEKQSQPYFGKSVSEAENLIGGKILGFRIKSQDVLMPEPGDFIPEDASILCFTSIPGSTALYAASSKPKLVLIDDNPVICRLYTRLFQKAGFDLFVAETGKEGLNLVQKHQPDAAIIDYHLPDITGLEVTSRIKEMTGNEELKIVLFTADDDETTKIKALGNGVDAVVVKSPDANEVVSQVEHILTHTEN